MVSASVRPMSLSVP